MLNMNRVSLLGHAGRDPRGPHDEERRQDRHIQPGHHG